MPEKLLSGRRAAALAMALIAISLAGGRASGATLAVDSTADSGPGSLRAAIASAADGDTIVFDASTDGATITLTTEISTTKTLSIIGNGSSRTILSGGGATRVLRFDPGAGKEALLERVTVSDGAVPGGYGGGIQKNGAGSLTLRWCVVRDCSAQGAGGMDVSAGPGTVRIEQSLFTGNQSSSSDRGGAIQTYNDVGLPQLFCISTTFSGNHSGTAGGAIDVSGGSVLLRNCTVTNNSAADHSGGLRVGIGYTLSIGNTIVAGNRAANNSALDDIGETQTISTEGNNIVGKVGGSGLVNGTSNDQVGTAASPIDPEMQPLADNGGESWTHALGGLGLALARNAGNNDLLADSDYSGGPADQRGFHRVMGSAVDIGAFEEGDYSPSGLFVTNTLDSLSDSLDGNITLRAALEHSEPGTGIILTASTPYGLSGKPARVRFAHYVQGGVGPNPLAAINATVGPAIIIDRYNSGKVTFNEVALASGTIASPPPIGGRILHEGTGILEFTGCLIQGGKATHGGGVAFKSGSKGEIHRSLFTGNTAGSFGGGAPAGGAIFLESGATLLMTNTTLHGNGDSATVTGGGIAISSGSTATIVNCTISGNNGEIVGGGIAANGTVNIGNTILAENTSAFSLADRNLAGSVTTLGNNLSDQMPTGGGVNNGVMGDIVTADSLGLLVLADYGGNLFTRALFGSPGINAGNSALVTQYLPNPPGFDQRGSGFNRILGSVVDIGAFESSFITITFTPTPTLTASPTLTPTSSLTPTVSLTPTATPTPFPCFSSRSGTFDVNSPAFNRAMGNAGTFSPDCNLAASDAIGSDGVRYVALPVWSSTGSFSFTARVVESGTALADTVLYLYCDPFDPASPTQSMTAFTDDDDIGPNGLLSQFTEADGIILSHLTQYWLVLSSFNNGDLGAWEVCLGNGWEFGLIPPVITKHPVAQIANVGQSVVLRAEAQGAPILLYSWDKQPAAGAIPGATTNELALGPLVAGDAGAYRMNVERQGDMNIVSSNYASLTVFDPPQAPNASYVGSSLGGQMFAGETLNVGFDFSNTGAIGWSSPQGNSLAVRTDADGLFQGASRLPFPDPTTIVQPGGLGSFVASVKAPATPGVYGFDLQMIEEGVQFFGPIVHFNVTVVARPNATEDWAEYD